MRCPKCGVGWNCIEVVWMQDWLAAHCVMCGWMAYALRRMKGKGRKGRGIKSPLTPALSHGGARD